MIHILIAPNAFKNSINANEAAQAIEEGLMQSNLNCSCECFPIGDGGDGTAALIIKKCNGLNHQTQVHDPLGRIIDSSFGIINNKEAVIEMADASGLRLLNKNELDPLHATSYGTGELIKSALDKGMQKIIIGMGGSATVDGGTGILEALGVRFLGKQGNQLKSLPESLVDLASIDVSALDPRILNVEVTVLCDVDNSLLGKYGSAEVFGPQKGASIEDVSKLELALRRFAEVTLQQFGVDMAAVKYGGTAGGAAAGVFSLINARLVNGIDYFLELTSFNTALEHTDFVITAEGSIDEQTLQGKGPFGVALNAKNKNIPVIALAGKIPLMANKKLNEYFDVLLPIGNQPTDMTTALQTTSTNLTRTAFELGNLMALPNKKN